MHFFRHRDCPHCGAALNAALVACPYCGTSISRPDRLQLSDDARQRLDELFDDLSNRLYYRNEAGTMLSKLRSFVSVLLSGGLTVWAGFALNKPVAVSLAAVFSLPALVYYQFVRFERDDRGRHHLNKYARAVLYPQAAGLLTELGLDWVDFDQAAMEYLKKNKSSEYNSLTVMMYDQQRPQL